eukprot:Rhum_TRINITY_DN16843_c0_g1::Rhum_TRINITY_DN16843_c0_g1_i1::g.164623::m.164623
MVRGELDVGLCRRRHLLKKVQQPVEVVHLHELARRATSRDGATLARGRSRHNTGSDGVVLRHCLRGHREDHLQVHVGPVHLQKLPADVARNRRDHAGLRAEGDAHTLLALLRHSLVDLRLDEVEDVGRAANRALAFELGLGRQGEHLTRDLEVRCVVALGVLGTQATHNVAAEQLVDGARALGVHLEAGNQGANGLAVVRRVHLLDLLVRELGHGLEQRHKVVAHVRVGAVPDRDVRDLRVRREDSAHDVRRRARDGGHGGVCERLRGQAGVDVHDVERVLLLLGLLQPQAVALRLGGRCERAPDLLVRQAVHLDVRVPLEVQHSPHVLGHEVDAHHNDVLDSLLRHGNRGVGHRQRVARHNVRVVRRPEHALQLRVHVEVRNNTGVGLDQQVLKALHGVHVRHEVVRLHLGELARRVVPLRVDDKSREGALPGLLDAARHHGPQKAGIPAHGAHCLLCVY